MHTLELSDILPNSEYLKQRDARRREIIALRELRRVNIGDKISLHFECKQTLLYQVQEMMRAENMTSLGAIEEEVHVYSELMPRRGELSATLFIHLTSEAELRQWLPVFTRLEGHTWLVLDGERIAAQFEPGRSTEEKTSSVHYVRFLLSSSQVAALKHQRAELDIDLPQYTHRAGISERLREELIDDAQ